MLESKYRKIIRLTNLTHDIQEQIFDILKSENSDSILSKLPKKIVFQYFDFIVNSNFLELYIITHKSKLAGYAFFAKKPSYIISEFLSLKYKIFFYLIINLRFVTILNLIISILKFDKIFINKIYIDLIENNYNLNLLAIKNEFQSQGLGEYFLKEVLKQLQNLDDFNYITCETFNSRAEQFYINKCDFKKIGKKIRLFKNLSVLSLKVK